MESNKTILYYTSNQENPEFEKKIRGVILENCDGLPIISVSQEPIDFGKNICVGEVGHSYINEFRQILIGAKEAKTEYLIFAEADFLYPKEYFEFNPSGGNVYRYDNVWLIFRNSPLCYRKSYSNGASICKREFVIKNLEEYLEKQPMWVDWDPFEYFGGETACVSFKTGNGMTKGATFMYGEDNQRHSLPNWGSIKELKKKFL